MNSETREDIGYGDKNVPIKKVKFDRDDDRAVYRVEILDADGKKTYARVGKEYLMSYMKIIERIK